MDDVKDYLNVDFIQPDVFGLEIAPSSNTDIDFVATYDTEKLPFCPFDEARAEPNGYTKPRVVADRSAEGTYRVLYKQRRYVCPVCKREILCESPYIRQGSKTTKRMDNWISQQALYHGFREVSQMTGGLVSRSQVGLVVNDWIKRETLEYITNMMEPRQMGVHIVGSGKNQYLLLSDLENELFLDIIPMSAASTALVSLLIRLSDQGQAENIYSELESSCLTPLKAVYAPAKGVEVSVARASVYRAYATAVHDVLENRYTGKKKKLLLSLVLTPLSEGITPIERDKMIRLVSAEMPGAVHGLQRLFELQDMILNDQWEKQPYESWRSDVGFYTPFRDFVQYLLYAKEEINNGFYPPDLHEEFDHNTELANAIIALNQTCNFEMLRARMLLTIAPDLVRIQQEDKYAGIHMRQLYATMQQRLAQA